MLGSPRKRRSREDLSSRAEGRTSHFTVRSSRRRKVWVALRLIFKTFLILGIFAGTGTLGYMAYDSPFFKIRKLTIVGNQRLRLEDVFGSPRVIGENILAVDTGAIARTIEQVPMAKRAIVNRQFSTQELVILIEERQPCAVWQVKDAKYFVDDEGVAFQKIASAPNLPVITDMDGSRIDLGARTDAGAVQLASQLTERLPGEIGTRAKSFEYLRSGGLVVVGENGQRARFGDMADFEFKLATWKAILEGASQAELKIDHTDLRFGYRPFVR